jgi:hypothetical protein
MIAGQGETQPPKKHIALLVTARHQLTVDNAVEV